MDRWLRIGGWILLAVLLLFVAQWIVRILFGFVAWLLGVVVTLLVLAILLYLAYLAFTKLTGGSGGSGGRSRSRSHERERIFE